MAEREIQKEAGSVIFLEGGQRRTRTLVYADTVVSIPPVGSKKVTNIYYDPVEGKLTVLWEEI